MQLQVAELKEQKLQAELVELCGRALGSILLDPSVQISQISVERICTVRFDSFRKRSVYVVRIQTNDASIVRGDSSPYKGSYKERIEGILDFYIKSRAESCDVHLEIDGPETGSVQRLIPVHSLIKSGVLEKQSPIVQTAKAYSMPDILIRGRHFVAPSPAVAAYLDSLIQRERVEIALDLFGGTGLSAKVLCTSPTMKRVTVVEQERAHLNRMKIHLHDRRVTFAESDAFKYRLRGKYDLIIADPYYEDAIPFLRARLSEIMRATRIFLFVPGNIEDIRWNRTVEEALSSRAANVRRSVNFGQVLFEVEGRNS